MIPFCRMLVRRVMYGRFPKFHRVFLGRDPGILKSDIVSTKTSTINLFGFETLKLKIRRLKLWTPTACSCYSARRASCATTTTAPGSTTASGVINCLLLLLLLLFTYWNTYARQVVFDK